MTSSRVLTNPERARVVCAFRAGQTDLSHLARLYHCSVSTIRAVLVDARAVPLLPGEVTASPGWPADKAPSPVPKEKHSVICAAYLKYSSIRRIAQNYNCPEFAISDILAAYRIPTRSAPANLRLADDFSHGEIVEIIKKYVMGRVSIKDLAMEYNCTQITVRLLVASIQYT